MKIKILNELLLLIFVTALLVLVVLFLPSSPLRAVLGFPALLLFPGYALLAALFPAGNMLGKIEWAAYTLGISIAAVSLIGIILNYTPWGLTLNTVLSANAVFIIVMAAVAWSRRYRRDKTNGFIITLDWQPPFTGTQRLADCVISGVLVLVMAGAAATMVYAYAAPQEGERFTEFYILGPGGKAADYAGEMVVGQEGVIIIGIINREREAVNYRVTVGIDGRENDRTGPVRLADGEKWEERVNFVPDRAGDNQKLEFNLYKNNSPSPYLRPLRLWINVKPSG